MENPWRILEFYSGIGGMRYSLMKAGIDAEVIEAFDINDTANDVYEHNFGHRPFQGNIQNLSAIELDKYKADAWLLSPPCQPYTRQDIVYPDSKRCCCFTKSYYRYVKGTGSLLATSEIFGYGSTQKPTIQSLKELGLRYFTPREVANFHSFPEDFCFPQHISIRQQYALLGNSLSVAVVAPLFRYLFSEPT